jgi:uncharacterized protein YjbI with pentapeptide repeats
MLHLIYLQRVTFFPLMKTKTTSLALLIAAGLLSSTVTASASIIYGDTVVNGETYNLSPGANLSYANLYDANLTGADLSNANLYDANLTGANLTGAILYGANLTGAYLSFANLSNANLFGANLPGAYLSFANLSGANLYYAYLPGAYLYNADLTGAYLYGADLSFANLSGATVSYSNWTDFYTNSGANGLDSYSYNTSLINYTPAVPEPSTYGLIGVAALGVALAARRKKQKSV